MPLLNPLPTDTLKSTTVNGGETMPHTKSSPRREVPAVDKAVYRRPPTRGEIAAAKLIMKRDREGKGNVEITPMIEYLSSFD